MNHIMTVKDVSNYLKVAEKTVYKLASNKEIPAFKVGGSWRFDKSDLDEWISQQKQVVNQ